MYVGDGTWDKSRNDFLLPNLQGLNFATMRYNGMGNRFAGLPEYHQLILGHGVLAAITFIGIVPAAIFLAKYGSGWPGSRVSFKLHVYLQILTVFLTTVILVLGWFAVGPERSLTNPHHGIGVAIYVLILFQFLFGTCMYRHERKRTAPPRKLPSAVYIHRLLGRSTALLAFVQIGLGLTLYGSPKVLFILYALAGFFLLFMYLFLEYYYKGGRPGTREPEFYSDYGSSYLSGSQAPPPPRRKKEHHWGRDLLAAGGAVGAYEWWKNRRDKKREEREDRFDESEVDNRRPGQGSGPPPPDGPPWGRPPTGAPPPSGGPPMGPAPVMAGAIPRRNSRISRDSWEDEKYSEPRKHTWRDRILEATGAFAVYEGARSLVGRRRRRDSYSEDDYDSRLGDSRLGPNQNHVSRTDVSRVEAGEAPLSPDTPRVNMAGLQPMTPSMTPSRPPRGNRVGDEAYDSRVTTDEQGQHDGDGDHTLRDSIAILGPIMGFREWNRHRRARRQADRDETIRRQELESEEAFNRRNSNRYPRPQDANQRHPSMSGTLLTGPSAAPDPNDRDESRSNLRPDTSHPPLPAGAGIIPSSSQQFPGSRQNITTAEGYSIPPPPPGPPPNAVRPDGYSPPQFGSAQMPEGAVNPDPQRLLAENTAANESSAYGRETSPSHFGRDAALGAAGVATAAAAGAAWRDHESNSPSRAQGSRNRLQKRGSATSGSVSQMNSGVAGPSGTQNLGHNPNQNPNSPPVSIRVTNDGQAWTFQRLNEEQAAADRASRRQQRRDRRRRGSSLSSGMEEEPPPGRYRRNGPMRDSNRQPITNIPPPPAMSSTGASQRRESELNLPPAPPVPQHSVSPQSGQGASPPAAPPVNESAYGSPGDAGTGTESAFDSNRKRRRAERARQQAAQKNRVEFE